MGLEDSVIKLENEIRDFKNKQISRGDVTNYYTVNYTPGHFVVDIDPQSPTSNPSRIHTIICHPLNAEKEAIFMPLMPGSQSVHSISLVDGKNILKAQNIIQWGQNSFRRYYYDRGGEAYQMTEPRGLSIVSNVDFYIETSYYDVWYNY